MRIIEKISINDINDFKHGASKCKQLGGGAREWVR